MDWVGLLVFVLKVIGGVEKDDLASVLAEGINQLVDAIREGLVTKGLVEYSYLLAAGVVTQNKQSDPKFIVELVSGGIQMLMANPNVKQPAEPLSVALLTAQSLARVGFVIPEEE